MEGILRLVREGLEGVCGVGQEDGRALAPDVELAESLGCSVTAETFSTRLQRLSKYTAEAQWRLQIVSSNHGNGTDGLGIPSPLPSPALPLKRQESGSSSSSNSGVRRRRKNHRHRSEHHVSSERQNGEVSTSTSDGGVCARVTSRGTEMCPCGGSHSWLVPAMLSSPESVLIACIRRGNYIEAQQVIAMYGLENSEYAGELVFMDRYREVLAELAQVEQKMESQSLSSSSSSSENPGTLGVAPAGRTRFPSGFLINENKRVLTVHPSFEGMAFYSISDVADCLLSTPSRPIPCLEDSYWLSKCSADSPDFVRPLLEELSPAAMAAFDLSCCQCQLWKTSRQLLETAERRLCSFLETRGVRVDPKVPHAYGIRGFPSVLAQVSKIINRSSTSKGSNASREENAVSPFGCSAQEVLLSCHSTLTEESISTQLNLNQRLEVTLQTLYSGSKTSDGLTGSSLLTALSEQAGLKQSELDSHPVRTAMKQLLHYVDQLCPFEPNGAADRPDYIRCFFDYINVLASVMVRSLWSEDQPSEVKLGNPLLLLLQSPTQLLSHLLFDRQVSPDRVHSLLQQERLSLSVQHVIVEHCCETLPLWDPRTAEGLNSGVFCMASITSILQQHAQECAPSLDLSGPSTISEPSSESEVSVEDASASSSNFSTSPPSPSSSPPSASFLLTPTALSFLKSRSPLVATLACLCASRGGVTRVPSSAWSGLPSYFRGSGRKEAVLDVDQISKEAEALLKNFPILRMYLRNMAEPVLGISLEAEESLGGALCGKPVVGMLFSGPQSNAANAMAAEAFQQAVFSDISSAGQLLRVRDWELRGRVVLQGLDRWSLQQCLEMLEFCLSDRDTKAPLREQLQQRKDELDMYKRMLTLRPLLPWQTWQEMKEESAKNPESVFHQMLEAKEFELCSQWVQLLEALPDSMGLEVSEKALDRRPGLAACHFLSDYLTLHFQSQMTIARRRHIHALHLGSKVLLTLPEASRQDYFSLLSDPLLMLEQMLMNLKVDWTDVAISTLRSLLTVQDSGITNQHIDSLLADYAKKALDFPYASGERSRSGWITAVSSPGKHTIFSKLYPSSISSERRPSTRRIRHLATPFTPPEKPPDRKDWIPDHTQHICMVCQRERFTMFNRRHHCRRCGRLVCHSCSIKKMVVDETEEPVRVCDQCYDFFHMDSDEEFEEAVGSAESIEGVLNGVLNLPEVSRKQYRLSPNAAENQQLMNEFYYEQAPSASLCVAILTLHSDHAACGKQLIGHCRSLSRKLTNPEVDARLLTDVMRQLLFSAKLMFVNAGCTQEPALCDSYVSKVDVLKTLVTANYKYIPSLDDIQEIAAVTRLRNQLLEGEYYQLAVEVSTKSGLDPNGVWQAWGMATLKAGNLTGAREKFIRCLKPPVDRNQLNHGSRLLQEIVQLLESTVKLIPSTAMEEDILAPLRELEEAFSETVPLEAAENKRVHKCSHCQECVFYLQTYGTHLSLITFFLRHDSLKDALNYLQNKGCSDEVFLEGIFQPCLERGGLGALQGLLETLDPTLESWGRYLLSACQLLQRRGYYHSLYQLQQFMMDHIRAAMTCIRFFSHGAQSYLQLGEQQRWLIRAKEHLRTYLQEQQSRRKVNSSSFRKKMSTSDVSRHIHTIELQLEVTRFLYRCENSPSKTAVNPTTTGSSAPPTLFGNSSMKVDVACKVMLGGKNIEEGFGIAYRVIQDFQLEALAVYMRVGQRLLRQHQPASVRQLLKCVGESGTASKHDCDAIVLSCISVAEKSSADAKELETLILECKSPENKIKAYLQCSKLRAAYLLAVKLDIMKAPPLIQEVMRAAESSGDSVMHDICRQWLSEHHKPSSRQ
ncbi:hypothetical protein DNTS_020528 [Danionella cerebrum]|uniref:Zinc finger FYVE domain-containing protein 26 n=1 Tax=Danionella cerebrum TaxID=2873325 RepID=A0A553QA85_9TELE|nr:hypothetical protein DNTS_020528 [Danionella translucida]